MANELSKVPAGFNDPSKFNVNTAGDVQTGQPSKLAGSLAIFGAPMQVGLQQGVIESIGATGLPPPAAYPAGTPATQTNASEEKKESGDKTSVGDGGDWTAKELRDAINENDSGANVTLAEAIWIRGTANKEGLDEEGALEYITEKRNEDAAAEAKESSLKPAAELDTKAEEKAEEKTEK
jgi:hypothetical protein